MTGSSSCQCSTTLYREPKEMEKNEKVMFTKLRILAADFLAIIGHSWCLDQKRHELYGTYSDKLDGVWDTTAENMMLEFAGTIHPMFRASSALERSELRSKREGKKTIHFNGCEQNVELILRTVMSANQLSIDGAVADICTEESKVPWLQGNQKNMQHKILWKR